MYLLLEINNFLLSKCMFEEFLIPVWLIHNVRLCQLPIAQKLIPHSCHLQIFYLRVVERDNCRGQSQHYRKDGSMLSIPLPRILFNFKLHKEVDRCRRRKARLNLIGLIFFWDLKKFSKCKTLVLFRRL